MKLIMPTAAYAEQIRAYRQAFLDNGDSMDGTGMLRKLEDPTEWLAWTEACRDPARVPQGFVPATQFIYVREDDGKVVGMIQIRHCFNDFLEKYGGHIGYSVAPDERRKGYAARMLRDVLPECRRLGLSRVLVTCDRDNAGSRKTILKNGGVYDGTVYEAGEGLWLERYWISIPEERGERP